ncbi:hypothetical protein GM3708_344 [Geminocystis sp. NIES-3708]|nr:hypothetical protein GM3708_344 [Geminocystis sp. NIES-3708]
MIATQPKINVQKTTGVAKLTKVVNDKEKNRDNQIFIIFTPKQEF